MLTSSIKPVIEVHSKGYAVTRGKELDNAHSENQQKIYFRPIINIHKEGIYGAEALFRWNHPDKGLLTPSARNFDTISPICLGLHQCLICTP